MLIKKADDKSATLAELEALAKSAKPGKRRTVEEELRKVRAGIKGERDAAYLIDFDYGNSPDMAVIHDLRLEINGRVAQIDHVLIHCSLHCFVLETKRFHAGLKITETGEFLRWNDWKKTYEDMASPLAQNERHISVLRDAFDSLIPPQEAGVPTVPVFHSYVLVPPAARINRPARFDTRRVIKTDLLRSAIDQDLNRAGVLAAPEGGESALSSRALGDLALGLVYRHQPGAFDYRRKFGLSGDSADSLGKRSDPLWEFSPIPPERQSPARKSPWVYIAVLSLAALAMMRDFSWNGPTEENPPIKRPPASIRTPAYAPAIPAPSGREPPISTRPTPSIKTKPESSKPIVHMDENSLTVTKEGAGTPIVEIRGNLPKVKEEMRRSAWGAKPTPAPLERPAPAECEFKPVMTDEEIAACRKLAERP